MDEKNIKELKERILEESAVNVGFSYNVMAEIVKLEPMYLMDIMAAAGEHLTFRANQGDFAFFANMFVTEAVAAMDYEDFSKIAKYFFGYRMTEEEILAEPIEITRANYQEFQEKAKELHELKYYVPDLQERISKHTYSLKKNENEAVAYDPINKHIAVIEPNDFIDPHLDLEPLLISDYESRKSNEEVLIDYLIEYQPELFEKAVEGKYDESEMSYKDYWLELIEEDKTKALESINNVLEPLDKEVYSYIGYGYCQGDVWELFYLKDKQEDTKNIDDYLEHTVTAYFRGSLVDIAIYDENDEYVESIYCDHELLWNEKAAEKYINEELYEGTASFVDIKTAYLIESSDIEIRKEDIEEILRMTMEERESYLSEGKEKHI
jgi:ltrM